MTPTTSNTPADLTAALAAQAAPHLQPPTDRDQAIMGWKARRAVAIREAAESAAWREAIRTGRVIRGGKWTVTLPADLSTSPAMAERTGADLDPDGRETLTATLPGDHVADPEASGRYSTPMLMAAIRQATAAAIRQAKVPGLSRDEREDLAADLTVEVWTAAADRLAGTDPDSARRDRRPRFGDLAGCLAPPRRTWQPTPARKVTAYLAAVEDWAANGGDPDRRMTDRDRRAADQGWMRRMAAHLIARGGDERADASWRTVSTPAGWASLDAIGQRPSQDGDGGGDPLDGAVPLADAIRAADDLAADRPAEDDPYLDRDPRVPGAPLPITADLDAAIAAVADLTPAPAGTARYLADRIGGLATAGDYLAAQGRDPGKSGRREYRRTMRAGEAALADLADRSPDLARTLARYLADRCEDRHGPTLADLAARPGLSMTTAARNYRAARRAAPAAPAATVARTATPAPHPLDRDAILRREARRRTARDTDRRTTAHLSARSPLIRP